MNAIELINPKTGKPSGWWACGVCDTTLPKDLADRCCAPCECGNQSMNSFANRCSVCYDRDQYEINMRRLDNAELVEWDGESMIYAEGFGYRDGWFDSPEDLRDYCACPTEPIDVPEFAFVGRKCIRELDLQSSLEQMTEDTYEDAELHVQKEDMAELQAAVDKFNAQYALTYYEYDYAKKVRVRDAEQIDEPE